MIQKLQDKSMLIDTLKDGAIIHTFDRKGRPYTKLRLGPNHVHAFIRRRNGDVEDLGISTNLLTNTGRDLWSACFGHATMKEGACTATSATSATPSGGGLTASQYIGYRVYMPVTGLTTPPVYGNILSNTTTVLTIDQWWTAADAVSGAVPAATNGYSIFADCCPRFMGLDTNASSPVATDVFLPSEITSGGCARARATYAHTGGQSTYTMQVVYSVTASFTNIHKMGLHTGLNPSALTAQQVGMMVFETQLNQDATVGNGDTLTVTDTITLSG